VSSVLDVIIGSAVTLAIREGVPLLWTAYKNRRTEPKKEFQKVFVEQARWFADRAIKLSTFQNRLADDPTADKFRLAGFISKLDRYDQWALKLTDVELLSKLAAEKMSECEANAAEATREADSTLAHSGDLKDGPADAGSMGTRSGPSVTRRARYRKILPIPGIGSIVSATVIK
jgi:hypothetical protein